MEFLHFEPANLNFSPINNNNSKRRRNCNYPQEEMNVPVRQRSQANARERDRTHRERRCPQQTSVSQRAPSHVNSAFSTLRTLIPTEPKDRKLSKIETLRLASSYIAHLGTQLVAGPIDQPCLRITREIHEQNELSPNANRQQVCTFCIAHKKTPNKIPQSEELLLGSSLDPQIFYSTQLTTGTDSEMATLYY